MQSRVIAICLNISGSLLPVFGTNMPRYVKALKLQHHSLQFEQRLVDNPQQHPVSWSWSSWFQGWKEMPSLALLLGKEMATGLTKLHHQHNQDQWRSQMQQCCHSCPCGQ